MNTTMTTIKLDRDFKDWLKNEGCKGETYQAVIERLIKHVGKRENE